ncbi:hypothetical protein F3K44_32825 [Bacillus megaterium]|nr:hypothetical protein [Priestia megaterium]
MKLSEINGIENDTLMLAKFIKSEYLQDFLNGNLYMNNFKYFVEQEKNSKHKGQGDSYEGAFVATFDAVDLYVDDVYVGYAESGELSFRNKNVDNTPLFSMSRLSSHDFKVIEDKGDSVIIKVDFSEQDIKKFKEDFGCDKVVFTINSVTYIEMLRNVARKINTRIGTGSIQYVDFSILDNKHEDRRKRFDQGHIDFLFHKHNSLKYQREFRFILPDIQVDQNYIFEVGKLHDIFYVYDIDDFFLKQKLKYLKRLFQFSRS